MIAAERPESLRQRDKNQSEAVPEPVSGTGNAEAIVNVPAQSARRLRLFYFGRRWSARVERMLAAVYSGFWLGWLTDADINVVVARLYADNELYRTAAHNLQGLFDWEAKLLQAHFTNCRSIIVAAAGGGREVIGLARAGWQADGFECNNELVRKSEEFIHQAGISARVFQARPDEVPRELQMYDGGIVGCGSLGHILGSAKRVRFLRALKSHLLPGSPLLLSVGRRPQGSHYHSWIYQIARVVRVLSRSRNSAELGDDPLDIYTHRFTEAELHSELREAGYEIITSVEKLEIYVVASA